MSAQDNSKVICTIFDSINKKDFNTAVESVDNIFQATVVPRVQTFRRPDGFRQILQNRIDLCSDLRYEI